MISYLTSMDTISLSLTALEIFDFKVFRVWPWPLTPKGHPRSKNFIPFGRPYMTFYLTSMNAISLSLTVFEIFDFKVSVFDLDLWPLKVIWGQQILYHSKGHIWLPIWLLWTPSLYLLPFSRYSTSKFSGFDLWPLKVIWGQKNLYHSKGYIWLPIWLLWTPSLYLLPLSRYSTSKFLGFDLDLWPLKVIWSQQILYHSKGHIWLPMWLLCTPSIYLLPLSRYSTSKFLGCDIHLWPLKVIWGQKILYHSICHIWLPIWLLWTPSLYLLPLSRYSTSKFLGFDLDLWPLKVIWGHKILYHSKGHIWLPIWLLCTPSLYLVQFSRWMPVRILNPEQNGGFWPFKGQGQRSIFFCHRKETSSHQTASFEILADQNRFSRLGCARA